MRKFQQALEAQVRHARLNKAARMQIISKLAAELFVSDAFDTLKCEPLPYHEASALAQFENPRRLLVAAIERAKIGREGRIHLIKTLAGHLAISSSLHSPHSAS